jgi:hypothetical protein
MSTFDVRPSTQVSAFVVNGSQSPEDALYSYTGEGLSMIAEEKNIRLLAHTLLSAYQT